MTKTNHWVAREWARMNDLSVHPIYVHNKNMHGEGWRLFSRQTAIATFQRNKKGEPFILLSSVKYSHSTDRQISDVRSACVSQDLPVFEVPYIGFSSGWSAEPRGTTVEKALEVGTLYLQQKLYDFCDKQVKWWKRDYSWDWRTYVRSMHEGLERWHRITGARRLDPINIDYLIRNTEERVQAKHDAYFDPKAVVRRERAAAKRAALQVIGVR